MRTKRAGFRKADSFQTLTSKGKGRSTHNRDNANLHRSSLCRPDNKPAPRPAYKVRCIVNTAAVWKTGDESSPRQGAMEFVDATSVLLPVRVCTGHCAVQKHE